MGGKSSPARAQEARANAKADRRSGGPAGAPCRAHWQGLPKVWAKICSQGLKVLHAPGDVIWTKVGNTYSPVFTQLGNTRIIHEYMYSLSLPRNCE